jgi:hypothetical protein
MLLDVLLLFAWRRNKNEIVISRFPCSLIAILQLSLAMDLFVSLLSLIGLKILK